MLQIKIKSWNNYLIFHVIFCCFAKVWIDFIPSITMMIMVAATCSIRIFTIYQISYLNIAFCYWEGIFENNGFYNIFVILFFIKKILIFRIKIIHWRKRKNFFFNKDTALWFDKIFQKKLNTFFYKIIYQIKQRIK